MKLIQFLYLCTACLLAGCTSVKKTEPIKITGSMKDMRTSEADVKVVNMVSDLKTEIAGKIIADSTGLFSIEFLAGKGKYYEVGHTSFYLSPGDSVNVNLKMLGHGSSFIGDNKQLNEYLNQKLPSPWDLFGYDKVKSFDKQKEKTDSLMAIRRFELNKLEADSHFKEMEEARIKAQVIKFYLYYFMTGRLSEWKEAKDIVLQKKKAFHQSIASTIEPLLQELTVSDKYLDLPDVREVLQECETIGVLQFPRSETYKEYLAACEKKSLIDSKGMNQSEYEQLSVYIDCMKNPVLQQALRSKLAAKANLLQGKPAIDIELEDYEGNKLRLSDLKGKPLYIDFWATWCLPCLMQMPHFENLSKEYPHIQFVGISIDLDADAWRKKLNSSEIPNNVKEYLTSPYTVSDVWDIQSIPRFLLIDKDFKIISSIAPRPSDTERIKELLDAVQ